MQGMASLFRTQSSTLKRESSEFSQFGNPCNLNGDHNRQKNMDFALSEAMKFFTSLKKEPLQPAITVIYDVMCQYGVHLEQRLEDGPFLEKPTMPIQKAIGKFHLGAHIDSCFSKFSLNFLRGAGHTDGEVLETLWAPLNKIAGSTRSMTLAHRQEVLDDCAYDSNWKKITNLSMLSTLIVLDIIKQFHVLVPSLIKKWKRAETSFAEMKEAYEDLRCRLTEDDLESWNSQAEQASLLRGEALEIYDVKIEQSKFLKSLLLYVAAHYNDVKIHRWLVFVWKWWKKNWLMVLTS